MNNAEILLRAILGPVRSDLRPLAFAVEITDDILFSQHISMNDFLVTKQVYPEVAKLTHSTPNSTSRRIERLAHLCWDSLRQQDLVAYYLGRVPSYPPDPCTLIVFLAVYSHLNIPFFDAIEQYPFLLISPTPYPQPPPDLPHGMIADALLRDQPLSVSQKIIFSSSTGITSFPLCPHCRISLEREFQSFCDRCGQRLDWKHFNHALPLLPGSPEVCT